MPAFDGSQCESGLMTVAVPRRPLVTSTEVLVAGLVVCALAGTWMRDGVAGNERLATAYTVFSGCSCRRCRSWSSAL